MISMIADKTRIEPDKTGQNGLSCFLRGGVARVAPVKSNWTDHYVGGAISANGPIVRVVPRVSGYRDSTSMTSSSETAARMSRSLRTLQYW